MVSSQFSDAFQYAVRASIRDKPPSVHEHRLIAICPVRSCVPALVAIEPRPHHGAARIGKCALDLLVARALCRVPRPAHAYPPELVIPSASAHEGPDV